MIKFKKCCGRSKCLPTQKNVLITDTDQDFISEMGVSMFWQFIPQPALTF